MFELLYVFGLHGRQLIMCLLDLCVNCSSNLSMFIPHEGSREALNFRLIMT